MFDIGEGSMASPSGSCDRFEAIYRRYWKGIIIINRRSTAVGEEGADQATVDNIPGSKPAGEAKGQRCSLLGRFRKLRDG